MKMPTGFFIFPLSFSHFILSRFVSLSFPLNSHSDSHQRSRRALHRLRHEWGRKMVSKLEWLKVTTTNIHDIFCFQFQMPSCATAQKTDTIWRWNVNVYCVGGVEMPTAASAAAAVEMKATEYCRCLCTAATAAKANERTSDGIVLFHFFAIQLVAQQGSETSEYIDWRWKIHISIMT